MEQKRILIVEDDEFIRELYERTLRDEGFSVESSESGRVGIELLDKNPYDLLILDLNMPEVSGFDILDHLQAKPKKGMLILVLSNLGEESFINKARDKGAHAYIIKSTYTPQQVVAEVHSLLK